MAADSAATRLASLVNERDALQRRIDANLASLEESGVGLERPLVDGEGFPLSGLDLYGIRRLRSETRAMMNDYKAVMAKIEDQLPGVLAQGGSATLLLDRDAPFARIDAIADGSVAFYAGLLPGDLVVRFGTVTRTNFGTLASLKEQVERARSKSIPALNVTVRRQGATTVHCQLALDTAAALGCHIVPI